MNELIEDLDKKELVSIQLQQEKLYEFFVKTEQSKIIIEEFLKKMKELKKTVYQDFEDDDTYVLANRESIEDNNTSYEAEYELALQEAIEETEYLLKKINKPFERTILVKREVCDSCEKKKNFLYNIGNKKICKDCL